MAAKICLFAIDPQRDFCDEPDPLVNPELSQLLSTNPALAQELAIFRPALPVLGAHNDMLRLAAWVRKGGKRLKRAFVTLDSHDYLDIAHPLFWVDANGNHPPPFTMISVPDVENRVWTPSNEAWRDRALDYVRELARKGRYILMVWPPHCIIGTPGHNVHPALRSALADWQGPRLVNVSFITKGSNPWTEHYSALQAEVPDPKDPTTLLNRQLIEALREYDVIVLAGEALSHCVLSTVVDVADAIGAEHVKKFVFLEDCSSPVQPTPGSPDFPAIGRQFITDMQARGMQVAKSTDFWN